MKKILLIEDDPDQIRLYQMAFEQSKLNLLVADNGQDGFKLALSKPDLILCDIILGDVNGVELLKKLKKNVKTKKIPVVMLTNLTKKHIVQEAQKAGALDFWDKTVVMPFRVVDKVKDMV